MDERHTTSGVCIGLLLAGGSGLRMGRDKRLLVLQGSTLLARGLALLRELFEIVAVSVAPGQTVDLGDTAGVEVVPDAWPGSSPLVGIASGLRRFGEPLFVLAADLAFPSADAVRRVLAASVGADACLPRANGYLEPLFGVYAPASFPAMVRLLERGEHRIVECLPGLSLVEVPFTDATPFFNVNTMEDYVEAKRRSERRAAAEGAALRPALVAIVGKSDSGKTTFIEKLLPELRRLGMRVGAVKHDTHGFEIDRPGKDSYRHGAAGAEAYVVSSPTKLAYIASLAGESPLRDIAARFFDGFDLVVAEGYKRQAPHRIEVFRAAAGHREPLCAEGEALALVTDTAVTHPHRFALDDAAGVAAFIAVRLRQLREY